MLSLIVTCWLGLYTLTPCDAAEADIARDYSDYALSIPVNHLATVRCLYRTAFRGEANLSTGCIGLPMRASLYMLAHEVGHEVSAHNGLLARFTARFWPGGVQVDGVPDDYARTNPAEDWAEAYSHVIMGDTHAMKVRRDWLLREFPELH